MKLTQAKPQNALPPEIKNLLPHELENRIEELGLERYRADQAISWVYQQGVTDWDAMTNMSKSLRGQMGEWFRHQTLKPARIQVSRDGVSKYMFKLPDGAHIESVLIPGGKRRTLCISSQVGCALSCVFCYTGTMGFTRNLEPWEMVEQFLAVKRERPDGEAPTNVVFMGMGEPLLNYENVERAARLLAMEKGINLSHHRITVSTVGIPEMLDRLADERVPISLALSINAPDDETRSRIMPVNKTHPLEDVFEAIERYPLSNRKRITFEYVMLDQVNDSPLMARQLANRIKRFPCKVNLIALNPYPGCEFKPSPREVVERFRQILVDKHLSAFTRKSRGADIMAACGQLVGEH